MPRLVCPSVSAENPFDMGALIITYTILGVPYYNSRISGPKTLV